MNFVAEMGGLAGFIQSFRVSRRASSRAAAIHVWLSILAVLGLAAACQHSTVPMLATAIPAAAPPEPVRPAETAALLPSAAAVSPPLASPPLASPPPVLSAPLPETGRRRISLTPPPGYERPVRVALLLPLSGPGSGVGQALLHAAEMALFDAADGSFALMPRDTRGTPEGAVEAADDVISEGAELVLGPFFASSVNAVGPRVRAARLNMISFSTDRLVAADGVFVMGFLPRTQVRRVVDYAARQGVSRFAALVPGNEYGETVVKALQEAADAVGGVVTQVEYYDAAETDLSPVVRRLANYDVRRAALLAQRAELERRGDEISKRALERLANLDTISEVSFQAIMLPEGGERLRALAALLPFFDIDPPAVRVLGTGQWDDPTLATEPGLVGGWFAAAPPEARSDFVLRYRQTFGKEPPRLATLAYDATALAAVLAQLEGGPKFDNESLTSPNGFAGLDGIFRFRPDGTVERGLAVLRVEDRGQSLLSPAPEIFETPTN